MQNIFGYVILFLACFGVKHEPFFETIAKEFDFMNKKINKEWFLDRYCKQQFAALVEDGKLSEFYSEQEPRNTCVGSIYKGKVTNVLTGMNAAFVNCGLDRNCYLSMDDGYTDCSKYDGTMGATNEKILDLKVGDEIIVQVTKPPRGNKGAKVTTHFSFVGKLIIYLPNTDFLGISRKIIDETLRERLLDEVEHLRESHEEGFILRTQAPFASQEQILTETAYLKKLYLDMMAFAKDAPVGTLLYEDDDLPARIMRDSYGEDVSAIHVGDEELYRRLLRLITLRKDIPEEKLHFHTGDRSLLKEHNISPLVYNLAQPTVPLDGGGYLVIEPTEAMTVVDVNSGSYVGENSLEETVFAVNLAAAEEIARQVRLRNVGGIVVVDFIDMLDEAHREAVTEKLREKLALDKAKCNVLPMSEFCITQFTRKRVGHDTHSYLVKPCPYCEGRSHVPHDIFVMTRIRTHILEKFAEGHSVAVVELNESIMRKILDEGMFAVEAKNRWKDKKVYFVPHKTYKEAYFSVRGESEEGLSLSEKAQLLL